MIGQRPLVVAGIVIGLLAGGCAPGAPGATSGPTDPAGPTPGSSNAGALPSVPPLATEDATYLAAAQAELELRRRLLEDVRAAEAIGPQGPAVLAETEKLETAFGEKALAEFVAAKGLDLTTTTRSDVRLAAIRLLPPPAAVVPNAWSGSLFGATSFMVSTWMGFAPELLQNAGGDRFVEERQNRNETHDTPIDGGLKEHLSLTQRLTVGAGRGRIVFDVVMTSSAVLTKAATGEEVARRTSTGNGHFEVNACPAANGEGEGRYRIINQELVTQPGGLSNGGASTTEATFKVFDGDDAHLIRTEVQAAVSSGVQGTTAPADGSAGQPIDWNAQATHTIVIPARGSSTYGEAQNAQANNATPSNRSSLTWLLVMTGHYIAEAAKKAEAFWRSGDCINMKTSEESKQVQPGQQLTINVDPTHKFDSAPVKAPVTPTFTGKESLDPQGSPQDPPVTLTFKAGREEGDRGTIELKQTGKRGIGKKTLAFTVGVADYKLEAAVPGMGGMNGLKCNGKDGAWTIGMGARGAAGSITFTIPRGATSAEAHAIYDVNTGGATAHWDVRGPVSFIEGDPAKLSFGTLRGRVTVKALGQSITTDNEVRPFAVPLQAGKFCT